MTKPYMANLVDTVTTRNFAPKTCSELSDLLPPAEIIEAAEKVRVWMEQNGYKNWQLGGVCDRRYATRPTNAATE